MFKQLHLIIIFLLTLVFVSGESYANSGVKLKDVTVKPMNNKFQVDVSFDGAYTGNYEVSTREGMVQIEFPNLIVWPKIEKDVSFKASNVEVTNVLAYQFDKNSSRVRIHLKGSSEIDPNRVVVNKNTEGYTVEIPASGETTKKKVGSYDESYLRHLLEEKTTRKTVTQDAPETLVKKEDNKSDVIKVAMSAPKKDTDEKTDTGFNMSGYVFKFVGFLALIIGGLLTFLNFFKKGFLRKGKLGFLHGERNVAVLNTTYVGPKRSLILVRAHRQVFMLASSEQGISLISEIADPAELLKDGERTLTGTNFDKDFADEVKTDKTFNLKDTSTVQSNQEALRSEGNYVKDLEADLPKKVTDKVSISDQIRKKAKTLKALQ